MAVVTLKSNAYGIKPFGDGHVRTFQGRATTSESWKAGAILIRASGLLSEAAADPVADIIGIAAETVAVATANQKVIYWPASPDTIFEATFEDETNEDHVLANANIFTDYALQVDASGNWYVDENDTTATSVMIVAPRSDGDIGATRARVLFRFLADILASQT